jgi:hypothetical protein
MKLERAHSLGHVPRERASIVEASDIPILSSAESLQRSLLKWVDLCGISGRYEFDGDVATAMSAIDMLNDHAYIVGVVGSDPSVWPIFWAGGDVLIEAGQEFGPAFGASVDDPRLLTLVVHEYIDAVRYRRIAARRYSVRGLDYEVSLDQLIFPLRDKGAFDYVLVHGEASSGQSLYANGKAS